MKIDTSNLKKGLSKRLTIGREATKEYQSYFIPIDQLFFNDQNGRIATYIEEDGGEARGCLEVGDFDKYNDIIAGYIKASANDNGDSFKKTKEDIKSKGQRIPGVILDDGRIIDGNRRFSCIRELKKETGDPKFEYFECVVLPSPKTKNEAQEIKLLELNIQFNDDEKKEYNRIDFLASFYNDTRNTASPNCIDKITYCRAAGRKPAKYDDNKRVVETRLDYLEWIGKPKAFSYLKKDKLDGPLEDIAGGRKKMSQEEWNEKKNTMYSYRTFNGQGDRTRNIRALMKDAKQDGLSYQSVNQVIENPDFLQNLPNALAIKDKKPTTPEETEERTSYLKKLQDTLNSAFLEGSKEQSAKQYREGPKNILDSVLDKIKNIHPIELRNLPEGSKNEILKQIERIEGKLEARKKACDDDLA